MSNNIIRAQKPDREIHHDTVFVPAYHGKVISRLREDGHVPYRCTRCFGPLPQEASSQHLRQLKRQN